MLDYLCRKDTFRNLKIKILVKGFYNIYVDNNLLQLVAEKDLPFISMKDETQEYSEYDDGAKTIMNAVQALERNSLSRVVIWAEDVEELWADFQEIFTPIPAAGGIVENEKGEILAMYRRKSWDLPKGKIEPDEKKKSAAIREVKEECGLKDVKIIDKLGNTYHTFGSKDRRKLKISTWYSMFSTDKKLKPQKEEDIEEVKWISLDDFKSECQPVYPNIVDVIEAFELKKNS